MVRRCPRTGRPARPVRVSCPRLRNSFSYRPTAPATPRGLSCVVRSVNGLMKDWELSNAIPHAQSAVVANIQSFIMTRLHHRGPPCFFDLSTRPPRSLHPPRPSTLRQPGSSARIGNTGTLSHGCESLRGMVHPGRPVAQWTVAASGCLGACRTGAAQSLGCRTR